MQKGKDPFCSYTHRRQLNNWKSDMSILTMESWPRHVVGGPDSLNGAMLEVADNGVEGAGGTASGTARPTGGHQPEGHRRVGYKWPWHKGALVSFLCLSCGSWTRLRNEQPTGGKATGEVAQRFRYQFSWKNWKRRSLGFASSWLCDPNQVTSDLSHFGSCQGRDIACPQARGFAHLGNYSSSGIS